MAEGKRPSWGSVTWLKPERAFEGTTAAAPEGQSKQPRLNDDDDDDQGWITQPEAELFLGVRLLPTHVPGTDTERAKSQQTVFSFAKFSVLQGCQPRPLQASPPPTPPSRGPGICGACKTACWPGMTPFTSRWGWSGAASASTPDPATGRLASKFPSGYRLQSGSAQAEIIWMCRQLFGPSVSSCFPCLPSSPVSQLPPQPLLSGSRRMQCCQRFKGKLKRVL